MTFLMVLRDYASWTSMAGIPRIASAPNLPLRIFWIIVWVTMFAIAVYQIYLILVKFFAFPITVATLIQMKPLEFPVVTVCSTNPYKLDLLKPHVAQFKDLTDLMTDYRMMLNMPDHKVQGADRFGLNKVNTMYKKMERAQEAVTLIGNRIPEHDRLKLVNTYEDMIKDCTFNDVPCGSHDFKPILDPVYGMCFAFNHNDSRMAYRAGMKSGLRLLLYIQVEDRNGIEQFLPTTQTAGARVRIAGKQVDLAMESFGIPVATGAQTKIGLKLTEIRRKERPYGICVKKDANANFYPDNKYTLDTCLRSCIQRRIQTTCQCAHPRYGVPGEAQTCGEDDLGCLLQLREDTEWNPLAECKCKPSCEETQYDTTISVGRYPSAGHSIPNNKEIADTCSTMMKVKGNASLCVKYYQKTVALLNVYFDTLNSDLLQEEAAYPALSALIELGGQIMLWLGISIISVIEMIGFVIVLIMYLCSGRKQKVKPADDELNKDARIKDVSTLKEEIDMHDQAYAKAKDIDLKWADKSNKST